MKRRTSADSDLAVANGLGRFGEIREGYLSVSVVVHYLIQYVVVGSPHEKLGRFLQLGL